MAQVMSLAELFWSPAKVAKKKITWLLPYLATVLALVGFGFFTRARITPVVNQELTRIGFSTDALELVGQGALYGVFLTGVLMPLALPWAYALISKFVALFIGARTTFAEYYRLYQWASYGSTIPIVLIKWVVLSFLPIASWGQLTLSLGALFPVEAVPWRAVASIADLSLALLLAFSWMGLRAVGKQREVIAPICTACLIIGFQLATNL